MKKNIFLSQVNYAYGSNVFLPFSVGLLEAYAKSFPEIRDAYTFLDLQYLRQPVADVVRDLPEPTLAGLSCYIWNWEYNQQLAQAIKQRWPECLVVLGGPQVPTRLAGFFAQYPWVDLLVHYEGEETFVALLLEMLQSKPEYTEIPGVSVRLPDVGCFSTTPRPRIQDLDKLVSPYLSGVFDRLLIHPYDFHASQETHRGCAYQCTFCQWGSSVFQKVRTFPSERLIEEFHWFARNHIELLYNADSNYGLFPRDEALTEALVETKRTQGFPKQFRAAYAKNSNDRVFSISKMLNDEGMSKGVTLSFQSVDETTLATIKRKNIGVKAFTQLMGRYHQAKIPTYTELIMGLPGETYESFKAGLETLITAGQHDSLQIYLCAALPDAEMSDPKYVAQHGIVTCRMPILLQHRTAGADLPVEYNDIVIETKTLSHEDWKRTYLLAWVVQAFHCLALAQFIAIYLHEQYGCLYMSFYEAILAYAEAHPRSWCGQQLQQAKDALLGALGGGSWDVVLPRFGDCVWPTEEATFLNAVGRYEKVCGEIWYIVKDVLKYPVDSHLFAYQRFLVKNPYFKGQKFLKLDYNFHSFFQGIFEQKQVQIRKGRFVLCLDAGDGFSGDLQRFAQHVVWYGRKGGTTKYTTITEHEVL